jgi:hypothetical protein
MSVPISADGSAAGSAGIPADVGVKSLTGLATGAVEYAARPASAVTVVSDATAIGCFIMFIVFIVKELSATATPL